MEIKTLTQLENEGIIELGRGKVISGKDLIESAGDYPVYSAAQSGNGEFGRYGKYAFDEELITWSVDGGGKFFYRPRHRFSVTNVSGYIRIFDISKLDYKYLFFSLIDQWSRQTFNYINKAHPSNIRDLYKIKLLPLAEQKCIADKLEKVFAEIEKAVNINDKQRKLAEIVKHSPLSNCLSEKLVFQKIKLEDIIEPISVQVQPKDFGNVIYVGLEHISSFEISLKNIGTPDQVRSTKWRFRSGDILYGKLRPYLNKCVVADKEGICSTDILVLRGKKNVISKYVAYLMSKKDFVEYANSTASGMNLPRTTWTKIKDYEIEIPVDSSGEPDQKIQQSIVNELEKGIALSEELKTLFMKQEESFSLLRSSVLSQSFQLTT